jgi:hypothetical protein
MTTTATLMALATRPRSAPASAKTGVATVVAPVPILTAYVARYGIPATTGITAPADAFQPKQRR